MSFSFQGYQLTYKDINNYFNDMKISRENNKKKQNEMKSQEIIEIIKNHKKFFIELNNKKLCKYGGNSSLTSVFTFNPDNEDTDEISNLLTLVIKNKLNKNKDFDYLNKKINISIILSSIAIISILFKIRNFY